MEASRLTAAGGVLLAAAIVIMQIRLDHAWAHGVQLAVGGVCFLVVSALALTMPPPDDGRPTPEQSALFVSALVILAATVVRLGQVATGSGSADRPGTVVWMALVYAAIAAYPAVWRRSAVCALAAAVAFGVAATEFVDWVTSGPIQGNGYRWIFALLALFYALVALSVRARRPRHAGQLANASMLGLLAIVFSSGVFFYVEGDEGQQLASGWEVVVVGGALAGIAYALLTRERGPAWVGGFTLLAIASEIGDSPGNLVGWPLALLIAAALALAGGVAQRVRT